MTVTRTGVVIATGRPPAGNGALRACDCGHTPGPLHVAGGENTQLHHPLSESQQWAPDGWSRRHPHRNAYTPRRICIRTHTRPRQRSMSIMMRSGSYSACKPLSQL